MTERPKFSTLACPISASRVVALREAFGEGCEVVWIKEAGYEFGRDERNSERVVEVASPLTASTDIRSGRPVSGSEDGSNLGHPARSEYRK